LNKQLELLISIQTIDTNIRNSEELQKKHAADIKKLEKEVINEEEKLKKEQEQLKDLEKKHRDRERSLSALEDQKKKIEDRVLSIKTNKEYQAALHEIENIKGSISKTEDEIIGAMDAVDSLKSAMKSAGAKLDKTRAQYEEKKRQIEEDLKTYLADIEKQKQSREKLVNEVEPDIFSNYNKIKIRHYCAVALTENEQCLGCSMKIPPQVYNEVVFGEKLIFCPNCQRILFVKRGEEQKEKG